jgi:hypothetical protein
MLNCYLCYTGSAKEAISNPFFCLDLDVIIDRSDQFRGSEMYVASSVHKLRL